jgi:signal transduction histidine kinase
MGRARSDTDFSNDAFDDAGCLNEIVQSGFHLGTAYHHIMKLITAFLAGKYGEALAWAERTAPMLLQVASMANTATYYFYHALTVAAFFDQAPSLQQQEFRQLLTDVLGRIKGWADHCPENFANRQALIEAEIARIEARDQGAIQLYEQAIASAHENGFVHNEAVAYEVAAAFYRQRGYEKFARTYLAEAAACYSRWGAAGKVRQPDAAGRDIAWRIGDLPTVDGDAPLLRIVLVNLIANALKFTRLRRQAQIEIGSLPAQTSETVIFVRDNGVGFDMAYADKLFGVFQRLHHAEEFEGTGIGLANVRRIIARHGGRTWAHGQLDGGAAFYITLPLPHTLPESGDESP